MSALERLRGIVGSQADMAELFSVSEAAIHMWFKRGYLPPIRAVQAQEFCNDEIQAIEFIVEAMEKGNDGSI